MHKCALLAVAAAIFLAGCAISGSGPDSKKWIPVTEGTDLAYEDGLAGLFGQAKLNNGMILSKAKLDFVTRYVNSYEPERRDPILRALLNAYDITNSLEDEDYEWKFEFQSAPRMRHPNYEGVLRQTSFINGEIRKGEMEAYFVVEYISAQAMDPKGFSVEIDGQSHQYETSAVPNPYRRELLFSEPVINDRFEKNYLGRVMCNLDYEQCRELVTKIVDSQEAIATIDFENGRFVETRIEDPDKKHVGALMKAVEAIYQEPKR